MHYFCEYFQSKSGLKFFFEEACLDCRLQTLLPTNLTIAMSCHIKMLLLEN